MLRAAVVLLLALSFARVGAAPAPADRVWFCPGPGTIDYIRLFERPEEWSRTRQLVSVFKLYQQHTEAGSSSVVGPNSYDALARAGVFRTLGQWGKKIAIESGAVKEFYCTPDAGGMASAVADWIKSMRAVESAGGKVTYLAMDEPFVAGRAPICDGPALEPTARRDDQYRSPRPARDDDRTDPCLTRSSTIPFSTLPMNIQGDTGNSTRTASRRKCRPHGRQAWHASAHTSIAGIFERWRDVDGPHEHVVG